MRRIAAFIAVLGAFSVAAIAAAAGPPGTTSNFFNAPDIVGTDDVDNLTGGVNSERIFALAGNDVVNAGPGSDWADGGRGRDELNGASGNDLLTGETCNRERCDPPETDVMRGGSGNDQLESNLCRKDTYPAECPDGPADDRLYGGDDDDVLILNAPPTARGRTLADGGEGNDVITGSKGGDTLVGGEGRDRIFARGGADSINVRDGERDVVDCGSGRDSVRADRTDRLTGCEVVTPRRKKR
jgi:Ca2+-binding RTX toxin-like protein